MNGFLKPVFLDHFFGRLNVKLTSLRTDMSKNHTKCRDLETFWRYEVSAKSSDWRLDGFPPNYLLVEDISSEISVLEMLGHIVS